MCMMSHLELFEMVISLPGHTHCPDVTWGLEPLYVLVYDRVLAGSQDKLGWPGKGEGGGGGRRLLVVLTPPRQPHLHAKMVLESCTCLVSYESIAPSVLKVLREVFRGSAAATARKTRWLTRLPQCPTQVRELVRTISF
ncbi:hypothetical protein PoB_004970900 [Plakobranchus ocellatus]|uniref:Uncharacterized protein n=1 Tax=Plakobranchus ocellatus TaxID=259542 RepID=A0AAV4BXS1_9GAST|nr:hypothetical protein PoB_004970900 [Plakobranchus ocellatus]